MRRRCNSIKALPSRPPRFFPLCSFFSFFLFYRPLFPTLSEEADKIIYDSSYYSACSMPSNESKGLPHTSRRIFFFFKFLPSIFDMERNSFRGIVFNVKKGRLNGVKRPGESMINLLTFTLFTLTRNSLVTNDKLNSAYLEGIARFLMSLFSYWLFWNRWITTFVHRYLEMSNDFIVTFSENEISIVIHVNM